MKSDHPTPTGKSPKSLQRAMRKGYKHPTAKLNPKAHVHPRAKRLTIA